MHKAGSMGSPISLLVFLVLTVVSAQAKESFLISAPSVFHMGVKERVLVHVGKSLLNKPVTLYLENGNTGELVSDKISTVCTQEGQLQSVDLEIDKNKFSRYKDEPFDVVLVSEILGNRKLTRVLVSQHRGYIFIQTDQPIYNPTQKVKYRIFTLDHAMRPCAENFELLIFNAAGNRIMKDLKVADTGIFSGSLDIPDVSEMGTWKIVAYYQGDQKNAAIREFKVKKFVLPSFEVTIQPHEMNYLLANSNFSFTITATYSYGQTINGAFHCRVGVTTLSQESDTDGEKENTIFIRGLQLTGSIKDGLGEAELNAITLNKYLKDQMRLTLADLEQSGAHLYIAASVTDITSGELQEAEVSLPVVSHPYSIDLSRTRSYFTPGVPFHVLVVVRLPDGSPAEKVAVGLRLGKEELINVITNQGGEAVVSFNLPVNAGQVALKVTVEDREENKIIKSILSSSQNGYLYMKVEKHKIYTVNEQLPVMFQPLNIKPKDGFIYYMVLSRGVLAKQGSVKSSGMVIAHQIDITYDMIPSFRLIGFYYDDNDDIVADSLWVDVKDECKGKVEVSGSTDYSPQELAKFTIDLGDQKGKVALQAVDKAIYALNPRNKLTLKQVFSSMKSYDLGCSYGGGEDMVSVLNDAGLSFISSSNDKLSQDRKGFNCESGFRRHRRSLNLQLEMLTLKSKYTNVKLQECCVHGLTLIPMKRTCEERAKRVSLTRKDLACVQAFKDCCIQGKMLRDRKKQEDAKKGHGRTASTSEIEEFFATSSQNIRRSFPPSFGFTVIDVDKKRTYDLPLHDSITTWELQAVSLSASHGFCVAQPFEFKVFKRLFVSLRLPYSVRQYEHLSIVPVIYNYGNTDAELAVHMQPTEGLCSPGSASTSTYVNITVPKRSSKSVIFSAIPMVFGSIPITIRLYNRMFDVRNDAIERILNVRAEGIEERKEEAHYLNFNQTGRSEKELTIDGHLPNNTVPGSSNNIFIRIEGEEFGPKKAGSLLSPEKIARLIKLPTGCAEQTMRKLAPTALALRYLDLTKRWFELPAGTRDTALQNTEYGYSRMMTYKNNDGSYGIWTSHPSSHWLTGLVVKVLSLVAERQAAVKWETGRRGRVVNYEEITHSVKYLLSKQNDDGSFFDPHPVYHRTHQREGSMTAFMTIALKRSLAFLPEKERNDTEASISKSTDYLLSCFNDLEWPFDVAITAYCLAFCLPDLAHAQPAWEKLQKLATEDNNGCRVWMDGDKSEAITVETTAYALLTAVAHKDKKWAESAACWLNSQENYRGGFKSTQDTIVAIEAMSEYALLVPPPPVSEVDGTFSVQGKSKYHRLTLKEHDEKVEIELKQLMGNSINVKLKGQGKAKMKIVKAYHLINPLDTCDSLQIEVKVKGHVEYTAEVTENYELYEDYGEEERKEEEDFPVSAIEWFDARTRYRRDTEQSTETQKTVHYEVCFSYNLTRNLTGMAIADITLLSGFEVQTEDLDQLKQSSEQYISHYETSNGRVLLYFNEMLENRECITFRAKQNYPVGLLQPAQAVFYDYYEPDRKCTVSYSAPQRSKEIARLCSESVCQCAERPCPKEKKMFEASKIKERDRQEHACRFPLSDYGYIADIVDVDVKGNFELYRMNVTDILRSNKDIIRSDNPIRMFAKRMHCKLKLVIGKKYLIMGKDGLTKDPSGEMQYLLESSSWIEQMPPEKKCGAQKKSVACKHLSGFLAEYRFQGCTQ